MLSVGLVGLAVALATGVASGASGVEPAWEDLFEQESGPLRSPWVDPLSTFRVDGDSGRAYAVRGSGSAWRDVGTRDHEIEVTPYKLTDGGQGNSVGGVTVAVADADNFVGYELVKTTPDFLNGPESKSVLYLRVGARETEVVTVQHPELRIDQTVDLRLRKVGRVVEAYLDDVLDARYILDPAQGAALTGTNAGLVTLTGPNNYYEARAFAVVEPPPPTETSTSTSTSASPSTSPSPSTSASASAPPPRSTSSATPLPVLPPAFATTQPTAVPSTSASARPPSRAPSVRSFRDRAGDVPVGADLRRLTVVNGNRILIRSSHRALRRTAEVAIVVYVNTTASRAGPEYKIGTVLGPGKDWLSVRRIDGWQSTTGPKVACRSSRAVDYAAETVTFSLAPACLGGAARFTLAGRVTQGGLRDWAPSRRGLYGWVTR